MAEVDVVRAGCLEGIAHGFLGRQGGVSTGAIAGLNVGVGADDDDAAVTENRKRAVAAVLPDAKLVSLYQVHSPTAVIVNQPWDFAERPKADAVVTKTPGLLLGIVTADCAPVLFADHEARVIGAAHAGWRGAHSGVIEATIEAMAGLGAKAGRICASIGPCISQASYEVDDGFSAQFSAADDQFFEPGKRGHHQFDLEAYVASRLAEAGVRVIEPLGLDTYSNEERYYSFRRATHRDELTYGRQFSLIGMAE